MTSKEKQLQKKERIEVALKTLDEQGITFKILSVNGPHLRIGCYDFWPGTDLFLNRKTNKKGRGLNALLDKLK